MFHRRGQTILEYTVIVIIIIGALISMQVYLKRGIQGRWKASVDDMGDQYDPQAVNSNVMETMTSSSNTYVWYENGTLPTGSGPQQGQWTSRFDNSVEVETKTGNTVIGSN